MKFASRNAFYLRISASAVLPLYLYLDEQHLEWMSERVLQHVLSDLRPLIIPKLIAEEKANLGPHSSASAKKGTLDVHRGDSYQFGYFLRNVEPHAVLIKTRRFTAAPPRPAPPQPQPSAGGSAANTAKGAPKQGNRTPAKRKAASVRKGKQKAAALDSEEELSDDSGPDGAVDDAEVGQLRRSTRRRPVKAGYYAEDDEADEQDEPHVASTQEVTTAEEEAPSDSQPDEMQGVVQETVKEEQADPDLTANAEEDGDVAMTEYQPPTAIVVDDEEEEKPKPVLSLRYQGFSIHGRCLCVIVEPYPPVRQQRQMSLNPTGLQAPRAPSIAPADFVVSGGAGQRAKTPLFLPDFDDERGSVAPAPSAQRVRPPVPLFDIEQDEEDGGMYAFSQILQSVGEHHTGAVDDDDEMEGMVLFGDADEAREL